MSRHGDDDSRWGGLTWGITLIALGLAFLAQRMGYLSWDLFQVGWPLIVAIMGLSEVIGARTAKKLGSGVTLTLMAGYFFVSVTEWRGLGWGTSWPLALVAVGCGAVAEAIAARFMPHRSSDLPLDEQEHDHE